MLLPHMADEAIARQEAVRDRLSTNLKLFRGKLSMSQEVLADRAGLHRTHVSQIERGNVNVALDTLVALAMALGVSEAQLLTEQDELPIPMKSGRKKALADSAPKPPRAKD
ncbi:DNA-binding XRE family transcriptional regulator [Paraburkholderia sp. GV068]|uniref:helix-turn-helix domain-containing protein n=1 Tax=unclassified Paraburkholderia TaxID=2615204 RepID=UPI000D320C03|nr:MULTISPECIES: helix-turn-helix transcriptional regulator [unclassified Paraburkholderia]PTQ93362.1 DNA-binding XRE family transcriptional regulator [Paraburkholderia sp. GV072]PUB00009.1 DNA-binding XRE family transcriptional regulator [Paraburkholderia sp. GV068]